MAERATVLITGATGFLGGRLARSLSAAGVPVRALGRNLSRGLALQAEGIDFRPVDLRDRAAMKAACTSIDTVVHAGALASAWAPLDDFFAINVQGTQNVIDGCLAQAVRRLIYISSPSVMSTPHPQYDLTESAPLPERFAGAYAESKKRGEDCVRAVDKARLEWVILRPKAIYGPGDRVLLPRLLAAGRKGRLPIIGDGETQINLTHVDDVVQAIRLAMKVEAAVGETYLITGGEAVALWPLLDELFARLGYAPLRKRISLNKANNVATVLEAAWKALPLPGEPPLTRYKVSILAHSQTYNIKKARRELGYAPQISLQKGLAEVIAAHNHPAAPDDRATPTHPAAPDDRPAFDHPAVDNGGRPPGAAAVAFTVLNAGLCRQIGGLFQPGGSWRMVEIPALFALIRHPTCGVGLFDTGYSRRFYRGTRRLPFWFYRVLTPTHVSARSEAVWQVRRCGVDPREIEWIVLSHFDPDHYGGLADFPNARVICARRAWQSVSALGGKPSLAHRILPGALPADLAARLWIVDPEDCFSPPPVEAIFGFSAHCDLFGDGSVRLVSLPGHKEGQIGAFVCAREKQPEEKKTYFLVGDGVWSRAELTCAQTKLRFGLHARLARDRQAQLETYRKIRYVHFTHPEVVVVPSHCPDTADALLADKQWRNEK